MKPKLIFRGPVLTASGYGVHSRQLLNALIDSNKFDISLLPCNWGNTSFVFDDEIAYGRYKELARKQEQEKAIGVQYDISVQVTIPPEFERLARFNIGVTAGIEVDRVSPKWIEKANAVDLLIVPSRHSAETYVNSHYQLDNNKVLSLNKPVYLCPEGVDTNVYNADVDSDNPFDFSTSVNFLCVGLGLDKPLGEDRKNISSLIKWFCEHFKGNQEVGLVLKIGVVGNSLIDKDITKDRVKELKRLSGCGEYPKIHIVHGRLSNKEMAALYKNPKMKALITLTHGEGFGLPILEAAACNLPIIATNWSGHLDFLHLNEKKRFVPVEYDLVQIPESCVWEGVMERGSLWANVKEGDFKYKITKLLLSYDTPKKWAKELGEHIRKEYDVKKTNEQFAALVFDAFSKASSGVIEEKQEPHEIIRSRLEVPEGAKTLLYTMPMSAGDVFISTAVVDALKKKYPEHLVFFATNQQYVDILKDNPDVYKILQWEEWMANVPFCEKVFDEVYTPNLAIQLNTSNWVRGGKGRRLAFEMAAQCQVEFGDYKIKTEPVDDLPYEDYFVLNPGAGTGQWEARNYLQWQEVINNLKKIFDLPIVQVGLENDPLYDDVEDFRGKTNYNQLAFIVSKAKCVIGIDSVTSHLAAGFNVPQVSIYGSSYAHATGPVYKSQKDAKYSLLESKTRYGCAKACYKYTCAVDKDNPCVNEVSPKDIVQVIVRMFPEEVGALSMDKYEEYQPKIAGYTTIFNGEEHDFPYIESVKSMLGFCDEVVVVDGGSTDGTYEKLQQLAQEDSRVKVHQRLWDWEEPGMDGIQKAFARSMCSVGENDFLWQQDADEVVHEEDCVKIKDLVKKFPRDVHVMHLPVVELWGKDGQVRTDRHSWKWRLSRNNWRLTHGIVAAARVVDMNNGRTYAKKGMSDGCEYIDIMTGDFVPHKGFYSAELDQLRRYNPEDYGKKMNEFFNKLPSVYHYSWFDLERKISNFKDFWNKCWSNLYNDPEPIDRFPDVVTAEDVKAKAKELLERGGEHGEAMTFKLDKTQPELMREWINKRQ